MDFREKSYFNFLNLHVFEFTTSLITRLGSKEEFNRLLRVIRGVLDGKEPLRALRRRCEQFNILGAARGADDLLGVCLCARLEGEMCEEEDVHSRLNASVVSDEAAAREVDLLRFVLDERGGDANAVFAQRRRTCCSDGGGAKEEANTDTGDGDGDGGGCHGNRNDESDVYGEGVIIDVAAAAPLEQSALQLCVSNGKLNAFKFLLNAAGADPSLRTIRAAWCRRDDGNEEHGSDEHAHVTHLRLDCLLHALLCDRAEFYAELRRWMADASGGGGGEGVALQASQRFAEKSRMFENLLFRLDCFRSVSAAGPSFQRSGGGLLEPLRLALSHRAVTSWLYILSQMNMSIGTRIGKLRDLIRVWLEADVTLDDLYLDYDCLAKDADRITRADQTESRLKNNDGYLVTMCLQSFMDNERPPLPTARFHSVQARIAPICTGSSSQNLIVAASIHALLHSYSRLAHWRNSNRWLKSNALSAVAASVLNLIATERAAISELAATDACMIVIAHCLTMNYPSTNTRILTPTHMSELLALIVRNGWFDTNKWKIEFILRLLLGHGADPNYTSDPSSSSSNDATQEIFPMTLNQSILFSKCCSFEQLAAVAFFVKRGASVNFPFAVDFYRMPRDRAGRGSPSYVRRREYVTSLYERSYRDFDTETPNIRHYLPLSVKHRTMLALPFASPPLLDDALICVTVSTPLVEYVLRCLHNLDRTLVGAEYETQRRLVELLHETCVQEHVAGDAEGGHDFYQNVARALGECSLLGIFIAELLRYNLSYIAESLLFDHHLIARVFALENLKHLKNLDVTHVYAHILVACVLCSSGRTDNNHRGSLDVAPFIHFFKRLLQNIGDVDLLACLRTTVYTHQIKTDGTITNPNQTQVSGALLSYCCLQTVPLDFLQALFSEVDARVDAPPAALLLQGLWRRGALADQACSALPLSIACGSLEALVALLSSPHANSTSLAAAYSDGQRFARHVPDPVNFPFEDAEETLVHGYFFWLRQALLFNAHYRNLALALRRFIVDPHVLISITEATLYHYRMQMYTFGAEYVQDGGLESELELELDATFDNSVRWYCLFVNQDIEFQITVEIKKRSRRERHEFIRFISEALVNQVHRDRERRSGWDAV